MSENLDLVRSICTVWERRGYGSVERANPEIEFVVADGPAPFRSQGLAGMAAAYRLFLSTWTDLRTEPTEYHETDTERVLVCVHDRGRGKTRQAAWRSTRS